MINKVGKSWLIGSMLIISSCVYSTVTLKVKDINGIPLKEVVAGYPCKIELIIEDAQRRMENPEIKGLDQFHLEGRETSMQMINGKTTNTYGFRARCNKPGSYTIGPARLRIEGKEYLSNTISITVVAPSQAATTQGNNEVFARVRCNKKQVVVGEKVEMSMRFYYTSHDTLLRDVGNPPEKGYTRKGVQGPFSGTELVNGVQYHYVEWVWFVYPTMAGKLTIPAYSFDYDTPKVDGQDHVFAGFSLFFNRQRYDKHRVYSNACEIDVEALPQTGDTLQGVGHFTSFTARITPTHVAQGEGMVLTLELVGDADLDAVKLCPLELSDVFKWYDSQVLPAQEIKNGLYKKSWEYIVQGLKPGMWEIPPQQFNYFDTKKRTPITLATKPQQVVITPAPSSAASVPNAASSPASAQEPLPSTPSISQAIDIVDPSGIKHIHESGYWYAQQERSVAWWLYLLLMALPVGFVLARWLFNSHQGRLQKIKRTHTIFKQTRLHLMQAERTNNRSAVYPLFISMLSNCLSVPASMVTDDTIERAFKKAGLSNEHYDAWKKFFLQAAAYTFYAGHDQQMVADDFFKQAIIWLDLCEKQL